MEGTFRACWQRKELARTTRQRTVVATTTDQKTQRDAWCVICSVALVSMASSWFHLEKVSNGSNLVHLNLNTHLNTHPSTHNTRVGNHAPASNAPGMRHAARGRAFDWGDPQYIGPGPACVLSCVLSSSRDARTPPMCRVSARRNSCPQTTISPLLSFLFFVVVYYFQQKKQKFKYFYSIIIKIPICKSHPQPIPCDPFGIDNTKSTIDADA